MYLILLFNQISDWDDYIELSKKDTFLSFHQRNIHQVAIEIFKVKNDEFIIHENFFNYNIKVDKFMRPLVLTSHKGLESLRNFGHVVWNKMVPNSINY